jgi:predicted transcriptional regulator
VASLGELERTVMERLWSADGPVAATTLRDDLGAGLALTTVHTVLSRLEQKGFVVHDGGRPRRFSPKASREEHAAELMHEVLGSSGDRQAVLARFIGSVDPEEARLLRELLASTDD